MNKVEQEAQAITKGLNDGIQNHDLKPVLDQLNQDKSTMSAKDYGSLLKDMNKEVKTSLPGLTLTDTANQGAVALTAQDKYGANFQITGDAAGAANLQKVAADAQMPSADTILAGKMQGAKLTATNADGSQNYSTADGGSITATKVDDTMVYMGFGKTDSSNFTIKTGSNGESVQYADNTAFSYDPKANADVFFDKNLNQSGTITRNADGTATYKKDSHFLSNLGAVVQGVAVIGTAAAANYDDYKIASNPNLDPAQKIWETHVIDRTAANAIVAIANPTPLDQ